MDEYGIRRWDDFVKPEEFEEITARHGLTAEERVFVATVLSRHSDADEDYNRRIRRFNDLAGDPSVAYDLAREQWLREIEENENELRAKFFTGIVDQPRRDVVMAAFSETFELLASRLPDPLGENATFMALAQIKDEYQLTAQEVRFLFGVLRRIAAFRNAQLQKIEGMLRLALPTPGAEKLIIAQVDTQTLENMNEIRAHLLRGIADQQRSDTILEALYQIGRRCPDDAIGGYIFHYLYVLPAEGQNSDT